MILIEVLEDLEVQEDNMNVMTILAIVSFVILICMIIIGIYINRVTEKTKISFKEGLDLTELPIITVTCDNKKLHFLLDTGSNISLINKSVLHHVKHSSTHATSNTTGIGGNSLFTEHYKLIISYKDNVFEEEFGAVDLNETSNAIKQQSGIELHGILGSQFFEKHKYILDYKDLTAYKSVL